MDTWDTDRMRSQFSFTSSASLSKTLRLDPLHFLSLQSEGSQQLWPTPGGNIAQIQLLQASEIHQAQI